MPLIDMQEQLTQREQEVFNLLITGATLKEIARNLHISFDTAATHQKNLYRKLGVHSVKELFAKYLPTTEALDTSLAVMPFPCPFDLTLYDNLPYGGLYIFDPDVFQYNGEYYPSPFKLGKGNRLIENEIYHVTCYFTANVDLTFLLVSFMDTSIEEEPIFTPLSGMHKLGNMGLKANTRYNLSTKILVTRTAGGTSPVANKFCLQSGSFAESRRIMTFHKFEVVKLPYLINQITSRKEEVDYSTTLPVSSPLIITFDPDNRGSWGGWQYILSPDVFQYNGKQTASPFKLGKGRRIVEDDIFLVTLFFTSNVDMDFLQIEFVDTTLTEDNYWTQLSPYLQVKRNIKAGTENDIVIKLLASKTASGTSSAENQFKLEAGPNTKKQPTLTFTKFEIVKIA